MAEVPQTLAEGSEKPGRDIASAFAITPSRDFDGGLLQRYSYTLTHADALAWLRLKREMPGRAKWALGAWFLAGGAVWGLLPEGLRGPDESWASVASFAAVIAVQFALLLAGRALWRHWRARRLLPVPVRAEFEEWIDCVAGTDLHSLECEYLSPELIGAVVDAPAHLFVLGNNATIVVPKRAFGSPEAAAEMLRHLRELAAGPYYFDR